MFCNINEALLAAVIAGCRGLTVCFLAHSAMLHGSLSAQRQTAFANAWCMSIALTESDMGYAQLLLAVGE